MNIILFFPSSFFVSFFLLVSLFFFFSLFVYLFSPFSSSFLLLGWNSYGSFFSFSSLFGPKPTGLPYSSFLLLSFRLFPLGWTPIGQLPFLSLFSFGPNYFWATFFLLYLLFCLFLFLFCLYHNNGDLLLLNLNWRVDLARTMISSSLNQRSGFDDNEFCLGPTSWLRPATRKWWTTTSSGLDHWRDLAWMVTRSGLDWRWDLAWTVNEIWLGRRRGQIWQSLYWISHVLWFWIIGSSWREDCCSSELVAVGASVDCSGEFGCFGWVNSARRSFSRL